MRSVRVQQDTLGRRGHKHDPLYKIRGLLRHGVEHLAERQQAKISAMSRRWRPDRRGERDLAVLPTAPLHLPRRSGERSPDRDQGVRQLPHLPDPEVAGWAARSAPGRPVLAYFDTHGVSNGGTEAINLIIEKVRD